ncbi:hypothetical protein ABT072_47075 [Streptomyces sp. NPDC002589]|uniref:hypothetical protein n=1 Tax=Streptomyces sp. NPDC002589 TaxID=3154420 RepID=UPI003324258E
MPTLSPARPRTCGTRILLGEAIRRLATDAAPGVPGMPRRTLLCELGVHGHEIEHAAIARFLSRPERGAAWAHWSEGSAPSCTAWEACPRTGDAPGQACGLFTGHPGACTFALDRALVENETRVRRISAALTVLADHADHEYESVLEAGHDSVLLAWDELRARRVWERLTPWDQAAVHRIVSRAEISHTTHDRAGVVNRLVQGSDQLTRLWDAGELPGGKDAAVLCEALTRLPASWQAVVLGGQRSPKSRSSAPRVPLGEAVQAAAERAGAGLEPPEPGPRWRTDWDDVDDRRRGAAVSDRLARLPYGWRVDAIRRTAYGLDALGASHEAALAINMLRSYGVYLAWNAPDTNKEH